MIWFTSDWHFDHTNIAGKAVSKWPSGYRDFDSTQKMNSTIIDTLQKYVKPWETVYHLGDFAFGNPQHSVIRALDFASIPNIHLILGNHDKEIRRNKQLQERFASVQDVLMLKEYNIFLSHYAHRVWPASHKGSIHLYGHSHGNLPQLENKSMDVGIDAAYRETGEYRPYSLEEILKRFKN